MDTLQSVINWLEETDPVIDREELKRDLASCFAYDGYEFCKNLDNKEHWLVDARLVEILDRAKPTDFAPS